jgi:outer membrane protein assembly factor BamB
VVPVDTDEVLRRRLVWILALTVTVGCGVVGEQAGSDRRFTGGEVRQPLAGHRDAPGAESWTPWPQALFDAQHTNTSTVAGPGTGQIRWTRHLEGNVTPGPVVAADGTIYAASNAGVLHALDPGTGQDVWTVDGGGGYGLDLSTSPAVLPSGLILWPGPHSTLFGISADGAVRWRHRLTGQVTSPAVTPDGTAVVGDTSGHLVALAPTNQGPGVRWEIDLGNQSYGSVALSADGLTAYQSLASGVVAVRDGEVVWRWRIPTEMVEVSPAVAPDGTVVIGTNDDYQYGLRPDDGSVRWRTSRPRWTYSSPGVTRDGIVYYGDHGNQITGLNATDGTPIFGFQGSQVDRNPGGIGIWTSVLIDAEHTAYAGTRQGLIYAVDRTGRRLWQLETNATVDSYPALTADGALIIGVTDGRLLTIADD